MPAAAMPGARGRFITLEGGEGTGKSTQVRLLAPWLRERGVDVVQTREPGGAAGAERIRDLLVQGDTDRWTPTAETRLLHYAARADHLDRTIRPALAATPMDRLRSLRRLHEGVSGLRPRSVVEIDRRALCRRRG